MRSELAKELSIILTIKVIAIALVWYLFFSANAPVIEPMKTFL